MFFQQEEGASRGHLKIFCIAQYHSVNVKFEEPYPLLPHTGQGQLPRGERGFLGWCVWGNYFRKLQLLSVILPLIALLLYLLPVSTLRTHRDILSFCVDSVLNVKALVGAFNQEKALEAIMYTYVVLQQYYSSILPTEVHRAPTALRLASPVRPCSGVIQLLSLYLFRELICKTN